MDEQERGDVLSGDELLLTSSSLRETLLSSVEDEDEEGVELVLFEDEVPGKDRVVFQGAALFAFTVNYIFGAGVLGIPHAVVDGGIVATCLLLVFSSSLCLIGMIWILECQERANVLRGEPLSNMVEFAEMCRLFLGARVQRIYDVSLTVFVVCSAWMYGAIFSVSLSKTIPILSDSDKCDLSSHSGPLWNVEEKSCWGDYLIYLGTFTLAMMVLVRTDIGEMKTLQLALTCIGLTALLTMVITVLAAIPEDGLSHLDDKAKYFNAANFGSVFGTFVFAQMCVHGVPLLSQIPQRKDIIRPVFVGVISTTTTLYLILGIVCAIFFGTTDDKEHDRAAVNKLITLDWQDYTNGDFGKFISFYIRVYPAVTCGAAAPLYAITLGNGWRHAYYSAFPNARQLPNTYFYVGAIMPSLVFASIMADISFMLFFVGISAFVIAFFIPPMMQLHSMRMVPQARLTSHSWTFSAPIYCYICFAFAVIALIYTLITTFI